jgi:hypothetical protein
LHNPLPITAQIAVAEIVGHDKDDIRRRVLGGVGGSGEKETGDGNK